MAMSVRSAEGGRSAVKEFFTATNVRTGRAKIFRQPEISIDTVMASACLPFMFNAALIKELRAIGFLWEMIQDEKLDRERYRDARLHLIQAEQTMLELGVSSKLNAEWTFLTELRDLGRRTAESWLAENFDDLGVRSTFDISFVFEESLRPAHLAEDHDESLRRGDRAERLGM